eukprot:COSAG02_NODE_49643_length_325_cov_1.128319_1_plen_85_part_00
MRTCVNDICAVRMLLHVDSQAHVQMLEETAHLVCRLDQSQIGASLQIHLNESDHANSQYVYGRPRVAFLLKLRWDAVHRKQCDQ